MLNILVAIPKAKLYGDLHEYEVIGAIFLIICFISLITLFVVYATDHIISSIICTIIFVPTLVLGLTTYSPELTEADSGSSNTSLNKTVNTEFEIKRNLHKIHIDKQKRSHFKSKYIRHHYNDLIELHKYYNNNHVKNIKPPKWKF